jgi:ribosome-binding factor A
MKNYRCERVADLITREVAYIMRIKMNDPRLQYVTITATRVTRDIRIADIYYTLSRPETDQSEVQNVFEKAKGFIRKELGAVLKLRYVPELRFRFDQSLEDGNRIWDHLESIGDLPPEQDT